MGFFDFFPYTNLHNVNLDWVLQRVKEWGELVEANNIAFHNLEEANASFKAYVESYLENLDVQEAINIKMDSLLESGVLTEYLQPYVSEDVTAWLEENITEPVGVVIDKSLTVEGACADAKATGENAFSEDAKNYLINCLMSMFWDNNRGALLVYNLEQSLFKFTIYNKYSWKLSRKELIAVHCIGSLSQPQNNAGNGVLGLSNAGNYANTHRCIVAPRGIKPFIDDASKLPTIYYPIPVPKDSKGVVITANFNSYYFGMEPCCYDSVNDIYIKIPSGTGIGAVWTVGRIEKTFNYVPDNTYILVVMKANNAGTANFGDNEPTEVNIDFAR